MYSIYSHMTIVSSECRFSVLQEMPMKFLTRMCVRRLLTWSGIMQSRRELMYASTITVERGFRAYEWVPVATSRYVYV